MVAFKVKNRNKVIAELDYLYYWDFAESEGGDMRFDWDSGQQSVWVREDGYVEGTLPKGIEEKIRRM